MNRRNALKNIGLSAGFVMATPTVMSILQSCTTDKATWTPTFLTEEQGVVLKDIIDVILPATDTPAASELNVAEFIDRYFDEVLMSQEQEEVKGSMDALLQQIKSTYGDNVNKVTTEQYDELLSQHLKPQATSSSEEAEGEGEGSFGKEGEFESEATAASDSRVTMILFRIRGMAVRGFKGSELIGETVLAYDPVPGVYTGCTSLEEVTGGKAWSL